MTHRNVTVEPGVAARAWGHCRGPLGRRRLRRIVTVSISQVGEAVVGIHLPTWATWVTPCCLALACMAARWVRDRYWPLGRSRKAQRPPRPTLTPLAGTLATPAAVPARRRAVLETSRVSSTKPSSADQQPQSSRLRRCTVSR
jgi:hypothetical protein